MVSVACVGKGSMESEGESETPADNRQAGVGETVRCREACQRPAVPDGLRASESATFVPLAVFCCATLSSLLEISSPM
ncbi:hypothetical protein PCO31010_04891 [Pandoraea commovens]|uniref:Uncharacterized protein n=1 Tax=Pandoraea commovens TaxID=2508289 RepID=A0A5E4YZV9_9BURK|nr:hypothetical protein PCO31010_04891 [Pandoraea commovens]